MFLPEVEQNRKPMPTVLALLWNKMVKVTCCRKHMLTRDVESDRVNIHENLGMIEDNQMCCADVGSAVLEFSAVNNCRKACCTSTRVL